MRSRPRVLHLAFEDHLAPGSGGGSIRTLEINSRLADRFQIDQIFAPYPAARSRQVGNLSYRHLGPRHGSRFFRQLGYFARLPSFVRRVSADFDLVVEDFAAPFGSIGVPHFSARPTISVVQWLFASEKSRQYHLPFRSVENFGVRSHRRFIAVSPAIANELRQRNPRATVDVIANGLPASALFRPIATSMARSNIVFLGRLEVEHKGLDLLFEAYAAVAGRVTQDLVIAGDGTDESRVRRKIADTGLAGRVHLVGRLTPEACLDFLASAQAVAMPSRYESFGMVAAEAAAVGTPVVAFDIACLRDLVPDYLRVPAFDVAALSAKLLEVCTNRGLRERASTELPRTVEHLSWDLLAERQAEVYLDEMAPS